MKISDDWKKEFRYYFDKNLRPKGSRQMKNLDREILVDFIENLLKKYQK